MENRFLEQKDISDSVKDISDRRVKVAISHMGSLDLDNDIIDITAYNKTLKERGPNGADLIWHLTDHNPTLKSAVGKFKELNIEGNYLVGITEIPDTSWGNDVLEFYKTGHINQHSVGFKTIKSDPVKDSKNDYRLIKEVYLFEGSAVLWAANPNTPTLGKSYTKAEAETEHNKLSKDLNILLKSLKDGRFTDSTFELIELRVAQINESIKNLIKSTQPVITVEPEVSIDNFSDAIREFKLSL
jgi:HK97 family phage prohead protease